MRRVHLFCPAFMDTLGTVEFEEISIQQIVSILTDPTNEPVWRSSWPGVREMLNRSGSELTSEGQRREIISSHRPMRTGELGILFRTTDKLDLKSSNLAPGDFIFTQCYRLK